MGCKTRSKQSEWFEMIPDLLFGAWTLAANPLFHSSMAFWPPLPSKLQNHLARPSPSSSYNTLAGVWHFQRLESDEREVRVEGNEMHTEDGMMSISANLTIARNEQSGFPQGHHAPKSAECLRLPQVPWVAFVGIHLAGEKCSLHAPALGSVGMGSKVQHECLHLYTSPPLPLTAGRFFFFEMWSMDIMSHAFLADALLLKEVCCLQGGRDHKEIEGGFQLRPQDQGLQGFRGCQHSPGAC